MLMKAVPWLQPDPKQPRKQFDERELDYLGDDMLAHGVLVPLLARTDGTHGIIIDGHRRWMAAQRKGIKELPVILLDKPSDLKDLLAIQLATVFHKADLTPAEKWEACAELMCRNPQWGMKDLASYLHVDPSLCTRLLSPSACIPAWQEALKAGKVGLSDCYQASLLSPNDQADLLQLKLSGASRDAIARESRKKRNGSTPSVKISRVKIAMPAGATVVVSGKEMSMPEVVELLTDTLKEAKKAAEQFDVKTFVSMMKDKSKG